MNSRNENDFRMNFAFTLLSARDLDTFYCLV